MVLLAVVYVIVWACSDGSGIMTYGQTAIVFAVLGILSISVFFYVLVFGRKAIARYGTWTGLLNTVAAMDWRIPRSLYTSSSSNYSIEPGTTLAASRVGEARDTAFSRLHAATGSALILTSAAGTSKHD